MLKQDIHLYEFGPFRLDTSERLLLRDNMRVPLTEKAFDTLVALVSRGGRLASKEELMAEVWPDAFVEENNLDKSISAIRQALGERPSAPAYVETVRGRGYRFVAPVREGGGATVEDQRQTQDTDREAEASAPASSITGRGQTFFKSFPLILGASVMAVGLSFAVYLLLANRARQAETSAVPRSIAVLPFKPLVAGDRNESLEMGMADTLINKLGTVRAMTVRPISAVRKYTSLEQDSVAAGRELGVEAVLDGHIQRAGERVRVTVRLLRIAEGQQLWADQFDEKFTDIFAVQDRIAAHVTRSLALRLSGEEERQLARRETRNPEAYQLYLLGRYFWNKRTPDGLKKGAEYFQQAIDLDPAYALAYSGLADSYYNLGYRESVPPPEARAKSLDAARRAVALDPALAEARTSLAAALEMFEWNFAGAEQEYRKALELGPEYATAHHRYGMFLSLMGRHEEALAKLDRAQQLDPVSLAIITDIGSVYIRMRRFDEAVKQLHKAIELDPNFPTAHFLLARCYLIEGRYDEALAEAQKARALYGGDTIASRVQLGRIYALSGRRGEALSILAKLEEESRRRDVSPLALGALYSALGDKDRAFQMFEKAFEERAPGLPSNLPKPGSEQSDMSSDPRLADLRRRVGLPP